MQYADAVACSNVVQSGGAVCAGGDQLGAGSIKVDVEHLVDVPSQGLEDLAAAHVPDPKDDRVANFYLYMCAIAAEIQSSSPNNSGEIGGFGGGNGRVLIVAGRCTRASCTR